MSKYRSYVFRTCQLPSVYSLYCDCVLYFALIQPISDSRSVCQTVCNFHNNLFVKCEGLFKSIHFLHNFALKAQLHMHASHSRAILGVWPNIANYFRIVEIILVSGYSHRIAFREQNKSPVSVDDRRSFCCLSLLELRSSQQENSPIFPQTNNLPST